MALCPAALRIGWTPAFAPFTENEDSTESTVCLLLTRARDELTECPSLRPPNPPPSSPAGKTIPADCLNRGLHGQSYGMAVR